MIIEKLEQGVASAKKYQTEATILLMQKEQTLRSSINGVIDESLTLLGKGVVWGRKFHEAFTAQTHRRAEKLKKTEEAFDAGISDVETSESEESDVVPENMKAQNSADSGPEFHKKQSKKGNRSTAAKKTKIRDRRLRAHTNGAVRAH